MAVGPAGRGEAAAAPRDLASAPTVLAACGFTSRKWRSVNLAEATGGRGRGVSQRTPRWSAYSLDVPMGVVVAALHLVVIRATRAPRG